MHVCILDACTGWRRLIGCLKLQVISAKEPLIIGLFCRKWPVKIRHLTYDCHSVCIFEVCIFVCIHTAVWICEAAVAQQPNEHYGYTYIHKYIQYEHVLCKSSTWICAAVAQPPDALAILDVYIHVFSGVYMYVFWMYVCIHVCTQRLGFARLLLNKPTLAIFNVHR